MSPIRIAILATDGVFAATLMQARDFFHMAGLRFSYANMHYVTVAGGNAFYEKRKNYLVTQPSPPRALEGITRR